MSLNHLVNWHRGRAEGTQFGRQLFHEWGRGVFSALHPLIYPSSTVIEGFQAKDPSDPAFTFSGGDTP